MCAGTPTSLHREGWIFGDTKSNPQRLYTFLENFGYSTAGLQDKIGPLTAGPSRVELGLYGYEPERVAAILCTHVLQDKFGDHTGSTIFISTRQVGAKIDWIFSKSGKVFGSRRNGRIFFGCGFSTRAPLSFSYH